MGREVVAIASLVVLVVVVSIFVNRRPSEIQGQGSAAALAKAVPPTVERQQVFPKEHIYLANDTLLNAKLNPGKKLPRVLMYTWCSKDTLDKFMNEVYWKCCYAHSHGFDVVFSDKKNFTGVAKYTGSNGNKALDDWYSEENMWALWSDIQGYLFSGKYDYVFMMGADVQILKNWLHWPVWAWDTGNHDITVMDQHHFPFWYSYGLNENNILFKPTAWTLQFIREVFEYRKGFHLQGDNGPYMETVLSSLGREALEERRLGYYQKCYKYLKIPEPSVLMFTSGQWPRLNDKYDDCFFNETDRLAGRFGYRKSKHIGFYPNFIEHPKDVKAYFPADFAEQNFRIPHNHYHKDKVTLGPWANCWSSVRLWWPRPEKNCFAYHWNGPKDPSMLGKVHGKCPDKTFDWDSSPYNVANKGN